METHGRAHWTRSTTTEGMLDDGYSPHDLQGPTLPEGSGKRQRSKKSRSAGKKRRVSASASEASAVGGAPELTDLAASSSLDVDSSVSIAVRDIEITAGRAGDHHSIQQLLASTLHRPSASEFQSQLEDPQYEPSDRIVVRRGEKLVGHAHILKREIVFGGFQLPVATVNDFVILPEFATESIANQLFSSVHRHVADQGACLAMLRTNKPQFFIDRGWSIGPRNSFSSAGAREILSQQAKERPPCPRPLQATTHPVRVRIWRHVEQDALIRLYESHIQGAYGPMVRSRGYWQWLISRRSYDQIYVATRGPEKFDLQDADLSIVGYAVMREGRILELAGGSEPVKRALLARACRDSIEHDLHHVRLDAAPNDSLHSLLAAAGGQQHYCDAEHGCVNVARLTSPIDFLQLLTKELTNRARAAGLPRPCELGLQLDGDKYELRVGARSTKLEVGRIGRSHLSCNHEFFQQLLLGHLDVGASASAGRVVGSTRVAIRTASALFPQLPLWRPPWDENTPD